MTTKNPVGNSLNGSTGSGNFVGDTSPTINSPTLVTPALGTPASGNLLNCTGGNWSRIDTQTASSSSQLDFINLGSTYSAIRFVLCDIKPATDAVSLYLKSSTDNGANFDGGAANYSYGSHWMPASGAWGSVQSAGTTQLALISSITVGNSTAERVNGWVEIYNPSAVDYLMVSAQLTMLNASTVLHVIQTGGARLAQQDTDAIRFYFSSGAIASGTIYAYGMRKT